MPIEFHCQKCNKLLRVPDGSAGKKAQCPSCQTILEIPSSSPQPKPDPFAAPSEPTGSSAPASANKGPGDQGPSNQGTSPFSGPGSFAPPGQTPPPVPPPISENPFASPTASSENLAGFTSVEGPIVPTRIRFDLLGKTWEVFTREIGAFLLMALILIGIFIGSYIVMYLALAILMGIAVAAGGGGAAAVVIMFALMAVFYVGILVGGFWIHLGALKFCLRVARGGPPNYHDLFSGGPYILRGMGVAFFQAIATFAMMIACIVPGIALQSAALFVAGYVLAAVLNLAIILFFIPAMCLVIDRDLGVLESVKVSITIMRGNLLTALGLWLVTVILGGIAAIITCGLGYLAVIPFLLLTLVMIYLGASGQLADSFDS